MNIHVPQTLEARTELLSLSATKHNMMTAQTSKPNIVIVQDSLVASYRMTKPNLCENMTKSEFFNVANRAINVDGTPLKPKFILDRIQAIRRILKLKNKKIQAYNGKGLISLILPPNFNYENKNDVDDSEPVVRIFKGVFYEGVFTKAEIGGGGNSILQILYKEYGKDVASTFIDNMQFLTNQWLIHSGFSVGIKDCIATKSEEINAVIEKCFLEAKGIEETTHHEGIKEIRVNAALSKARDIGLRIAKNALDVKNNFLSTVNSGSKGDFFNIAQITGLLGQQNLCGKRVPKHLNQGKRTLPHYPFGEIPKEMEYESRGFIRHSFIHGLNPQEFYFHAMSGREGITDTAMGTSKSGYIQRRIVKVMEDISVKYDGTIRNTEGNIFQFSYGDDGFDASETIFKKGEAQACDITRLIDKLNMEEERK
jgi:DNA-directed RNA polymerase II subunit RPB1